MAIDEDKQTIKPVVESVLISDFSINFSFFSVESLLKGKQFNEKIHEKQNKNLSQSRLDHAWCRCAKTATLILRE